MRRVCSLIALTLVAGCGDEPRQYYREPSLMQLAGMQVLRLIGSPYEMGFQHASLMANALRQGVAFVETDPMFSLFVPLARSNGYIDDALRYSYPDALDECRGMVDGAAASGVAGWDMDKCLVLAYGDVIMEHLMAGLTGSCSQFAVAGPAARGGELIHARNLDWWPFQYLFDFPTIIVRRPQDGIPFVSIGFPGLAASYSGMNLMGLVVASNENTVLDDRDRQGHSHQQMEREILQRFSAIAEVEAFLRSEDHATAESFMVSQIRPRDAAVFEMSASHLAVRRMGDDGVVFMTNHFVDPELWPLHVPVCPDASSCARYQRLSQLLLPGGEESIFGKVDLAAAVGVLRDRFNPATGHLAPAEMFETTEKGGTLANNGAIHSMVFLPERLHFYLAAGAPPVPQRTFTGFSLEALLEPGVPDALDPSVVPATVP